MAGREGTGAGRRTDPSPRGGATTVAILGVIQMVMATVPFGIGALAPILRDRYDLTRGEVGLAVTAVFTSIALLSMPMGRFADRVGVSRALTLSSVLVGSAAAAMGLAGRFQMLLAFLVVVGIGYAAVTPATNKGVLVAVSPSSRGRAMGFKQMGVTAGGVVAAAILPSSIQGIGWEPTMFALGATIGLLGWGGALAYRRRIHGGGPPRRAETSNPPVAAARLLGLGCIIGIMIGAQHAVGTYLSLFLVDERGMAATTAAGALTILHASGTGGRLAWGYVSDRLPGGRWRTVAVIGASSVATLTILALVGDALPLALLFVLIVLLGLTTQAGNAVFQTALAEEDEEHAGRASGIGMSIGFAGPIVVPPVFGAGVDATGSYVTPFLLTAVAVAGAAVLAFRHSLARPTETLEPFEVREADGSLA